MTLRSLVIGSVRPRSSLAGAAGVAGFAAAGAAGATNGLDSTGRASLTTTGASVAGAETMSSLRIRPPTPVPTTVERSTPRSAAILRTRGVAYALLLLTGAEAVVGTDDVASETGTETGAETGLEAGTEAATGSGVEAATAGAGAVGAVAAGADPDNAPMVPSCPPTRAMPSSATVISSKMPATGDGISVSTLSVETSSSASSAATESPMAFNQRVTVPSVTLSPNAGSTTGVIRPLLVGAAGADSSVTGATDGTSTAAAGIADDVASEVRTAGAELPDSEMTASAPPTRTTASSPAMISVSTPLTGDGISVSTLSVETSSNGSSAVTVSPTAFSQRVTVPSVTLSPSWGIDTVVATVPLLLLLVVLRLSVKRGHGAACQPTP